MKCDNTIVPMWQPSILSFNFFFNCLKQSGQFIYDIQQEDCSEIRMDVGARQEVQALW